MRKYLKGEELKRTRAAVLSLYAAGYKPKKIAEMLGITTHQVNHYRNRAKLTPQNENKVKAGYASAAAKKKAKVSSTPIFSASHEQLQRNQWHLH